jgi:hypothetical protein
MNREALAWAAGLFDGEGCVHLSTDVGRDRTNRQIVLVITQAKSPEVLERFRDALGFGRIRMDARRTSAGNPVHEFRLSSFEQVQAAVAMLWTFLSEPKREQAATALRGYLAREPKRDLADRMTYMRSFKKVR